MTNPDAHPRPARSIPARGSGSVPSRRPGGRPAPPAGPASVTAVVVTRGTTPYLEETLAAVRAQDHAPDRLVVVDVARDDDRRARPGAGPDGGPPTVLVHAPHATSFGVAVRAGLEHLAALGEAPPPDPATWLWLLHDDATPRTDALGVLVRAVEHKPSVALAGVKQVEHDAPRRLVSVGVTTSPAGRRMTTVEPGETDQGQHDGVEDVLAVGLAGALVRADLWETLGGPDPEYGNVGDGLELSRRARLAGHRVIVVPGAVVRHAQATYRDLRRSETDPGHVPDVERSFRLRRRAELWYRVTGSAPGTVWLQLLVVVLLALPRALWQLGAKRGRRARAEISAAAWTALRPLALWRSRRRVRRARVLPRSALVPLRATWRDVVVARRDRRLARAELRRAAARADAFALAERRADLRRRTTALVVTALALVGLTLWWLGKGLVAAGPGARLVSPSLLPAGGDLAGLWHEVADGWVRAGVGDAAAADPLLTALLPFTALVTPFGGTLQDVVDLLVLGALLLAGTGAWLAAGTATKSLLLRGAAALAWVAAPALGGALATGRLGDLLAHLALPWAAWGTLKALGLGARPPVERAVVAAARRAEARRLEREAEASLDGDDDRAVAAASLAVSAAHVDAAPAGHASVPAATAGGLALALAVAGAPVLLAPALCALLVLAVARGRGAPRGARRLLLLVAAPALLVTVPLVVEVVRRGLGAWPLLLASPGRPVDVDAAPGWQLLLGLPTPAAAWDVLDGLPAWAVTAVPTALGGVVVLCALGALARRERAGAVRAAWLVATLALAAGGAAATVVVGRGDLGEVHASAGGAVSLLTAALVGAGLVGLDGVTSRVARHAFGWRQVMLAVGSVVGLVAAGASLASGVAATDLAGADGLRVLDRDLVPAVGRQMQEPPRAARVLLLEAGDATTYTLLRADGPQLADASVVLASRALDGAADPAADQLGAAVASLVGGVGTEGPALVDLGVGAVLVAPAPDADARGALVARLDTSAALERVAESDAGTVWRVAVPGVAAAQDATATVTGWARVLDGSGGGVVVPSDGARVDTDLPRDGADDLPVTSGAGWDVQPGTRTLVLAERADPGWRATLDGRPLEPAARTPDGAWQQTFTLPADGGGHLEVWYASPGGGWWRVTLVVAAVLLALLAVPVRRRTAGR